MTQKEIDKFLANTKVYVAGKSKEIQEKLFSLGYEWCVKVNMVRLTEKPFLFIHHNHKEITWGDDRQEFTTHDFREITAEEILSLELTKPSYRPFNDKEECWNEMLKHQPFGWLKNKSTGVMSLVNEVSPLGNTVSLGISDIPINSMYSIFTFADGTPLGIKED